MTTDRRDLRDPKILGCRYSYHRSHGVSVADAVTAQVPDYEDKPYISANPAEHHSQTPQKQGDLNS